MNRRGDEKDRRLGFPVRRRGLGIWTPFEEMERWFDELRRGMWSFGPHAAMGPFEAARAPPIDLMDTGKEVIVTAELPGVAKEDVEIEIRDDRLSLSAESRSNVDEEEEDYEYRERSYASFERSVHLPSGLEAGKAAASLKNGVLEVVIPYSKGKERQGHRIAID